MKLQYKNFPFEIKEIKEDGDYGIIKGYASTFGDVDRGQDRVIKGAFTETLQKFRTKNKQIPMLFQHGSNLLIGGFEIFKEDDKGLYVEGKINLKVQKGVEIHSLAKQGVLKDFSIGYYATDYDYSKEDDEEIRNLTKIDLVEVSMVINPMNENANITDVKKNNYNSVAEISKKLKEKGFSNKEANEIIYHMKTLSRNDDTANSNDKNKDNNNSGEHRNDSLSKIDSLVIQFKLKNLINLLKEQK